MSGGEFRVESARCGEVLEVAISGHASQRNAAEIARQVVRLAAESGNNRVLVDCRALAGRLTLSETFFHVKIYPALHPHAKAARTAVVDLEEHHSRFTFQEELARDLGFDLRFFTDVKEARSWLAE
jgi:hypothetical protein